MAKVVLENLSKIYNKGQENEVIALNGINFTAEDGEFIVILGNSGAGKSTLLNLLGGMDHATEGTYKVGDVNVTSLKETELAKFRRNNIGFVFQFYNLMPNLTALENVELAESVAPKAMNSLEAISAVGLENRRNNFPSQLSGGEQQRVAIARAVVKNPDLLLCDEPTGALDSKTGVQIVRLLLDINKKNQTTVIIVTHNALIAEVASRVIRVQDGKIISDEHNDNPKNPEEISW